MYDPDSVYVFLGVPVFKKNIKKQMTYRNVTMIISWLRDFIYILFCILVPTLIIYAFSLRTILVINKYFENISNVCCIPCTNICSKQESDT